MAKTRYGGHLKDITARPLAYRYGKNNPRPVRVSISRYWGFPHYFSIFQVDDQAVWEPKEQAWVTDWDKEVENYDLPYVAQREHDSLSEAIAYIREVGEKYYCAPYFKLVGDLSTPLDEYLAEVARDYGDHHEFIYRREGD